VFKRLDRKKCGAVQERVIFFCRKNEMGEECGTYGQEESFIYGFGGEI
jgi:hypothetical protein